VRRCWLQSCSSVSVFILDFIWLYLDLHVENCIIVKQMVPRLTLNTLLLVYKICLSAF